MAQAPKPTSVICRSELPSRRVCTSVAPCTFIQHAQAELKLGRLLVAEDGSRICASGPQGWESARDECSQRDQDGRGDEHGRVTWIDAEEQRRQAARREQRADGAEHDAGE